MPLTISVGLTRKVGEPNFGSRGASLGVSVELDSGLLRSPRKFRRQVAALYELAEACVETQLAGGDGRPGAAPASGVLDTQPKPDAQPERASSPATAAQVRAVYALCRRNGLDPLECCQQHTGCAEPEQLSLREASRLIDRLSILTAAQSQQLSRLNRAQAWTGEQLPPRSRSVNHQRASQERPDGERRSAPLNSEPQAAATASD